MRASCVKVLGRPTDDAADMLGVTGDDEKDDKHSEARTRAEAAGRPNVCVAGGRGRAGDARLPGMAHVLCCLYRHGLTALSLTSTLHLPLLPPTSFVKSLQNTITSNKTFVTASNQRATICSNVAYIPPGHSSRYNNYIILFNSPAARSAPSLFLSFTV